MKNNQPQVQKPKFAYVNFFAQPHVKNESFKLLKYKSAFDFLFILQNHYKITVFDFIGKSATFTKEEIDFQYFKKTSNNKLLIPWKLFWRLRKLNPKAAYIQGLGYPHYIIILKLFLKSGTKILVHDHANSVPKQWKYPIYKWADRLIEKYFFTSKELATPWLQSKLISSDTKIVECVEGSTDFKLNKTVPKNRNSFLWVGRLDRNKDPMTVLNSFANYTSVNTQARLTMFYEDTTLLPSIKKFIMDKSLESIITLMGSIPNRELEVWYQKSEYFILGSHKEGGPFSLIEAMACGCIPIVTRIPAFESMTDQGDCGYLYNPGDSNELYQLLLNLDENELHIKRNRIANYFENELSHQAIALKITKAVSS